MTAKISKIETLNFEEIEMVDGANAGPIGNFFHKVANALLNNGSKNDDTVGRIADAIGSFWDIFNL